MSDISDSYISHTTPSFLIAQVRGSQQRKVLPKFFEKLLGVDMLWKGILRLLGSRVAALKISNLDRDKNKQIR